jgi:hypothetical protein
MRVIRNFSNRMQLSEDKVRQLGDKDLKHYFEVVLLQQYWGADRQVLIDQLEEEMRRRSLSPDEARRVILDRAPQLDAVLASLWEGKPYLKEEKP